MSDTRPITFAVDNATGLVTQMSDRLSEALARGTGTIADGDTVWRLCDE
jgi:hypothetical protein